MATRQYKRSTRFSTYREYKKDDMDVIIEKIKETGLIPSGKYVSPSQIEPYLKEVYFDVIKHKYELNSPKDVIDEYVMKFINLSQPVQLSLVKRFKVGDSFEELQSLVSLKLLEIIHNNTYDRTRSSLTSWVYENIYQVLLKHFKDEKEYEKRQISLINFDLKKNTME